MELNYKEERSSLAQLSALWDGGDNASAGPSASKFTDLMVLMPGGRQINCHKVVLAATSPRFASALLASPETKCLPVLGVCPIALEATLKFMYTGECVITAGSAVQLYDVSTKLELRLLATAVERYMNQLLHASPAETTVLLDNAIGFGVGVLVEALLAVVRSRFDELVLQGSGFTSCRAQTALRVLQDNQQLQDPSVLLQAAVRWILADPTRVTSPDTEAIANAVGTSMGAIQGLISGMQPQQPFFMGAAGGINAAAALTASGPTVKVEAGASQASAAPSPVAVAPQGADLSMQQAMLLQLQQQQQPQVFTLQDGSQVKGNAAQRLNVMPMQQAGLAPPGGVMALQMLPNGAVVAVPATAQMLQQAGLQQPPPPPQQQPQQLMPMVQVQALPLCQQQPQQPQHQQVAPAPQQQMMPAVQVQPLPFPQQQQQQQPALNGVLQAPPQQPQQQPPQQQDGGQAATSAAASALLDLLRGQAPQQQQQQASGLPAAAGGLAQAAVAAGQALPAAPSSSATLSRQPGGDDPAAATAAAAASTGALPAPASGIGRGAGGATFDTIVSAAAAAAAAGTTSAAAQGSRGGVQSSSSTSDHSQASQHGPKRKRTSSACSDYATDSGGAAASGAASGGGTRAAAATAPGTGGAMLPPGANGDVTGGAVLPLAAAGMPPGGWWQAGMAGVLGMSNGGGALQLLQSPVGQAAMQAQAAAGQLATPPQAASQPGMQAQQLQQLQPPSHPQPAQPAQQSHQAPSEQRQHLPPGPQPLLPKGVCHVDNCGADLAGLRDYHQRFKICDYHLKIPSIMRDGIPQRFCQQCGRFHAVSEFDGNKRSCRVRLEKHNARRRRNQEAEAQTASSLQQQLQQLQQPGLPHMALTQGAPPHQQQQALAALPLHQPHHQLQQMMVEGAFGAVAPTDDGTGSAAAAAAAALLSASAGISGQPVMVSPPLMALWHLQSTQ